MGMNVSEENTASIFRIADRDNRFFRNAGMQLRDYMVLQPTRL
jgi:hypothetical protein